MVVDLSSHESPQVKLIHDWNQGFHTGNVDLLAKHLHEDFRYVATPPSLNKPEQNREEWIQTMKEALAESIEFPHASFHSVADTPGKVVLHSSGYMKVPYQEELVKYDTITTAEVVDDGDGNLKIKRLSEEFTNHEEHVHLAHATTLARANK